MNKHITLAVLAGGQARRMGGRDKGLVLFKQKPLLSHVLESVPQQIDQRLIIANRHLKQYAHWGYPVYPDAIKGYLGPLAGIHSALLHAKTQYVLCLPCDTPLLPQNLAKDLYKAIQAPNVKACTVFDGKRTHASCILLDRSPIQQLETCLQQKQLRVQTWLQSINIQTVDFSLQKDKFINLNSLLELQKFER